MKATEILNKAAEIISERAESRDLEGGEYSMERCVKAFNILEGTNLTEEQGWRFMSTLKRARATAGSFNLDDYIDDTSYTALCAERIMEKQSVEGEAKQTTEATYKRMVEWYTGKYVFVAPEGTWWEYGKDVTEVPIKLEEDTTTDFYPYLARNNYYEDTLAIFTAPYKGVIVSGQFIGEGMRGIEEGYTRLT